MSNTDRRSFLGSGIAVAAAATTVAFPAAAEGAKAGLAFSNRVHLFARPEVKERLIWCLSTVVGCGAPASLKAQGLSEPILAFRFPDGGSLSIEFREDALDEQQARRGAWLEIGSNDPPTLQSKILDAGLPQVIYPATSAFYFAAPGGQVFGIAPARDRSAGESRNKQ
jgi:hypothetical protein